MLVTRSSRLYFACLFGFLMVLYSGAMQAQAAPENPVSPTPFVYVSPHLGTTFASAATTIVVRHTEPLQPSTVNDSLFSVLGSQSGSHSGTVALSADGHTIFFKPSVTFVPGEEVEVEVQPGLKTRSDAAVPGTRWTFTISTKPYPYTRDLSVLEPEDGGQSPAMATTAAKASSPQAAAESLVVRSMPRYITASNIDLHVTITTTGLPLAEGYLFAAPLWNPAPARGRYSLLFTDQGELVYYRALNAAALDFKKQPNGQITYFDGSSGLFRVLDNTYQQVGTWSAGNGYPTDLHELLLLPNGHALLMIYDAQPYDLSSYGGPTNATVIALVIQEVDANQNVYFEWNSLDHIPLTDTNQPLTIANVDYVHGNAIAQDSDGNILVSSRHLSEITKINRNTGDIIWRLGGKQNQFTFIGDTTLPDVGAFSYQHDIRRLPNGNITLFDNGNDFMAAGLRESRGVEYRLDETAKTATLVREFRTSPDTYSEFMGDVQRLENGNTLIGWGGGYLIPPNPPRQAITEFTPDGQVALSATYDDAAFVSYRAFRFPWHGYPTTPPALVAVTNTLPISLYYSWNGATEVVSYTVAGGALAEGMTDFAMQPKTGFEEQTGLENAPQGACFFRVTPYDILGQQNLASNFAYLGDEACPTGFTASPTEAGSRAVALPYTSGPATVTLSIDAGAVTTTTVFAIAPVTPTEADLPTGKAWAGVGFALHAYDPSFLAGSMTTLAQPGPVQLTIDYHSLFAPRISTLSLVRWDAAQGKWSTDGITLVSNDTQLRQLTASVTGSGTFALLVDNKTPVSANSWVLTDEDTPYPFQPANFAYYDGDGDPIQSIVVASLLTSGTLTYAGEPITTGQVITTGAVSQLVFMPPPDANGLPYTSFGFSVGDGFATSPVYTATILVRPVNDAPVAVDDMLSLAATDKRLSGREPLPLDVLANDYDVDGDRLRLIDVSNSQYGAVSIINNQLLYLPGSSSFDLDVVTYTITDDHGGEATATVRLSGLARRLFLPSIEAQGAE